MSDPNPAKTNAYQNNLVTYDIMIFSVCRSKFWKDIGPDIALMHW